MKLSATKFMHALSLGIGCFKMDELFFIHPFLFPLIHPRLSLPPSSPPTIPPHSTDLPSDEFVGTARLII